ncbi:beta-lactamase class A [Rhizobiales bacterium GAS188]|nr:beta-lactamase class A [Rhizobiales bacterium GAS188]
MTSLQKASDIVAALRDRDGIDVGFSAIHLASGQCLEINASSLFPTASVFKVPVMVEVFRQARAGIFAMSDRLTLATCHKTLTSGVLVTLDDGLRPTIGDLVMLMTIVSDNTATKLLLDLVGMDKVNAAMAGYGLHDIHVAIDVHEMFLHAWGLPLDRTIGVAELRATARAKPMDYASLTFSRDRDNTVASAADMARLMAMIAAGEVVDAEACGSMVAIMKEQQYSERVPRYLPFGSVANKTGTMRGVRNDSGIMRRGEGDDIAYAVFSFDPTPLAAGNSRFLAERNSHVAGRMAELGFELWENLGK